MATSSKKQNTQEKRPPESGKYAFGRKNYIMMFIGLGLLFLGYVLMIGGGSDNPNEFSYEIFNFQRLTLAPILVLAGFTVEIFAIMIKSD